MRTGSCLDMGEKCRNPRHKNGGTATTGMNTHLRLVFEGFELLNYEPTTNGDDPPIRLVDLWGHAWKVR